ncbi:hypothetical protein AB0H73_39330 [Streptomyces olivoreticuli]
MSEQAQVQLALADKAVTNVLEGMKPGQAKKLITARMQLAKAGVTSEESILTSGRIVGMAAEMILFLSSIDDVLSAAPSGGTGIASRSADLLQKLIEGVYNFWLGMPSGEKSAFAAQVVREFVSLPKEAATDQDMSSLLRLQELCVTIPSMFHGSGHPEELAVAEAWESEMVRRLARI